MCLRFTFGSSETKSIAVMDVEPPWIKPVAMEVEESANEDTVVTLKLEGAVDVISVSVVIVSSSDKTFVADTEVVSFLITEAGLSYDRLAYFLCLNFICDDNLCLPWKILLHIW